MKAIAVDLGGTQIRAAVIDQSGQILSRSMRATPAHDGPQAVVGEIAVAVAEAATGFDAAEIVGIGVASPGPIDTVEGVTLGLPSFTGFDNIPLKSLLSAALGREVRIENDAIAAAIGEWRFGAGRGCNNMIYLTISTGLGGGIISDGKVLRGKRGIAAHAGHLTLFPDGAIMCNCGNYGCWEAYASGPAFEARARAATGRQFQPDAPSVFAAARHGDDLAHKLVAEEARLLGLGMVSLLHLFSPERIILGGGLSHHFDLLKPGIMAIIMQYAMPPYRDVELLQAAQMGNSGLLGAAALVL